MFRSIFSRLFWTYFITMIIVLVSTSVAMYGFLGYYTAKKQYDLSVKTSKNVEYLTIVLHIENNDIRSKTVYNSTLASWSAFTGLDITVK